MKYIYSLLVIMLLLASCNKEETEIMDMRINPEDITRIELRADHQTLIPNGKAKMEFHTFAYISRELVTHVYTSATGLTTLDTTLVEYKVALDQLPVDFITVYNESGVEVKDNIFSTSSSADVGKVFKFTAKAANLTSNTLDITIRELPAENYEEIVIPVIFHMIVPPESEGINYDISSSYLQETLDRMNEIFNGKRTADPNGGNAKVTFKLAVYNPSGLIIAENGKNIIKLSQKEMNELKYPASSSQSLLTSYNKYITKYKNTCVWDPARYLNIWVCRFSTSTSATGTSYTFSTDKPVYIASEYENQKISGLTLKTKDSFGISDVDESVLATKFGIMINPRALINPQIQSSLNHFTLARPVCVYYGVDFTSTTSTSYPATDPDFCNDTNIHNYNVAVNQSVYKTNSNYANRPSNVPLVYFTSFNVMDIYTKNSSITADQASRMRDVMKKCPDRWAYKSNFAFTGK